MVTEHLAELVFAGQPDDSVAFHRVQRPFNGPVEVETRFPARCDQFHDHVTDDEDGIANLWPRYEKHVAIDRRP